MSVKALGQAQSPVQPADPTLPGGGEQAPGRRLDAKVALTDCRAHDSEFGLLVREVAADNSVEPRALAVRTLLHLPRVAGRQGEVKLGQIRAELTRCVTELRADQSKIERLLPTGTFRLKDLRFVADYSSDDAAEVFTHLHYLRNARPESRNYALVDPVYGQPISVCSISPLEWHRVGRQLDNQFGVPMSAVWDISRVYSFDVAPENSISYLLAKVRRDLRQKVPDAQLLVTAVDQNLGFSGSSYLAANWQRWMSIKARPYLYYDRSYVSPRQLRARFQTQNVAELRAAHGNRFRQSRAPLLDSLIFCCRLHGETEAVPPSEQRRLNR